MAAERAVAQTISRPEGNVNQMCGAAPDTAPYRAVPLLAR
jgi:hypothetical protein